MFHRKSFVRKGAVKRFNLSLNLFDEIILVTSKALHTLYWKTFSADKKSYLV